MNPQTIWGSHFRSSQNILQNIAYPISFYTSYHLLRNLKKKKKTEEKEIPERLRSIM